MACSESTRNLWRLRLNWFIVLLLSPVLYSFSYVGVLSSFHRFVTDPRNETVENNKTVGFRLSLRAWEQNTWSEVFNRPTLINYRLRVA